MRAKCIFLKKLSAVALTLGVVLGTLAVGAQPASAAGGFQVTDKQYEKSYQLDDGKAYFEAKGTFPVIKGSSKAAKKINQELAKQKNKWISQSKKEAAEAKSNFEYWVSDGEMPLPEWTYTDEISYEIKSNDGNYFSVLMSGYLFQGGAHGTPYREAMTFDAKTGRKLTAAKLFGTTKSKLNSKVRKLYLKKYDKEGTEAGFYTGLVEGKSDRDVLKENLAPINFNNAFYVKNGKAVFYADPYALGPYAAGFIEASSTVK